MILVYSRNSPLEFLVFTFILIGRFVKSIAPQSNISFIAQVPPNSGGSVKFGQEGTILIVGEHEGFIDPVTFITRHALPSVPVVMRNSVKRFPAYKLWKTDDYFLSLDLSDEEFVVIETKKKENRSMKAIDMHFQDFVEVYNETNQYMVNGLPDFLGDDVILPWSLQCKDIVEDCIVESIMWFSSGGTKSVVHTDSVDNINCVFSGNKSFVLVDPSKYWEEVPLDNPEGSYSGIDVDNIDYEKYPGLRKIEYYHVNLSAGDCLFIPYRWIHQVRSYGRNIAVNIWWDHHANKYINLNMCEPEEDLRLTINNVNFIGFDTIINSANLLRDQFREYARMPDGLTLEKLKSYLIGDSNVDPHDATSSFLVPIKKIIKVLDINLNGVVILNEVLVASDDVWEIVSEEMERAVTILDHLIDRANKDEAYSNQRKDSVLSKDEL